MNVGQVYSWVNQKIHVALTEEPKCFVPAPYFSLPMRSTMCHFITNYHFAHLETPPLPQPSVESSLHWPKLKAPLPDTVRSAGHSRLQLGADLRPAAGLHHMPASSSGPYLCPVPPSPPPWARHAVALCLSPVCYRSPTPATTSLEVVSFKFGQIYVEFEGLSLDFSLSLNLIWF
jgi:hypothetical protein